jgi:hypothetical protein
MSQRNYALSKNPGYGLTDSTEARQVYTYDDVWDAEMMWGCDCDKGYGGAECGLKLCKTGDDPLTGTVTDLAGLQYNEKQTISCRGSEGSFQLSLSDEMGRIGETIEIGATDSVETVYSKLNNMVMIKSAIALPQSHGLTQQTFERKGVEVAFSTGKTACTPQGNVITVEFLQNFGDLALMMPRVHTLQCIRRVFGE